MRKIKISARSVLKFIPLFTILVICLSAEVGLPQDFLYINDILLIILVLFFRKMNVFKSLKLKMINYAVGITCIAVLVGTIGNLVNPVLILWGFRNTFRGIIYFYCCVLYLFEDDVREMLEIFVKLQYLNLLLGLYQFFVLGLKQDLVGGMFGHGNGNALGIYCIIVTAYSLIKYFNTKENLFQAIFCFLSSLILAAIAEEKFLFFEIAIVFIITLALSNKSFIKLAVIPIFFLAFQQALQIFDSIFPGITKGLTSLSYLEKYGSSSWLGSYYIPRIGSYTFIKNKIFKNNIFNDLFGFGMGNCDTSSFKFLQGPYFKKYGFMNYRWIFQQWTIMENGIVGFWCFVILFLAIILSLLIIRKDLRGQSRIIVDTSIATGVLSIMTMWMNNTLKVDTSYIPYFVLAGGFVCYKCLKYGINHKIKENKKIKFIYK